MVVLSYYESSSKWGNVVFEFISDPFWRLLCHFIRLFEGLKKALGFSTTLVAWTKAGASHSLAQNLIPRNGPSNGSDLQHFKCLSESPETSERTRSVSHGQALSSHFFINVLFPVTLALKFSLSLPLLWRFSLHLSISPQQNSLQIQRCLVIGFLGLHLSLSCIFPLKFVLPLLLHSHLRLLRFQALI